MGVNKLTLLVLFVVSVCGQNSLTENNAVSDNVLDVGNVEPVPQAQAAKEKEADELLEDGAPVEILPGTESLDVKSGKYYQLNDGLVGEQPVNLDAVDFSSNNVESEKQLLFPDSTLATNNEYGKNI